jgi:hypothetical protein
MTPIYIESADEITTVIERLRAAADSTIALVAPKGAALLQSVVNLKLTRKAAADAGKQIIVVTTDKVGRNLCDQLGILAANTEEEATKILSGAIAASVDADAKVIAGVRIHNYKDDDSLGEEAAVTSAPSNEAAPAPILIPKQMLKEEVPVAVPTIAVPASVPEPTIAAEVVTTVVAAPLARTQITRDETPPVVENVAPDPTAVKTKVPKLKEVTTVGQKRVIKLSLFLGGIALLIIFTLAFLFLPITRVTLSVKAADWTKQLAFSASTDLKSPSSDNTSLPAEDISVSSDKTISFKATGTKDAGTKATGTVNFSNSSTTNNVTVPSGTTITAGGQTFLTTADSVVSGLTISGGKITPGTGQAPITASQSGPASNMSNTLGNNVTVGKDSVSTVVTASGGTSKTVTIVSQDDITKAKTELATQLTADAKQKLDDQLTNRDVTFKEGADISQAGDVTVTVAVGDQVDGGDAKGNFTIHRTVVNNPVLTSAITDRLRADQLTNHTYKIDTKTITVTNISSDGKIISLSADLTGKEIPVIPAEDLASKLGGKTLTAGAAILKDAVPTGSVRITQKPSWWPIKRYPSSNRYILIDVVYE